MKYYCISLTLWWSVSVPLSTGPFSVIFIIVLFLLVFISLVNYTHTLILYVLKYILIKLSSYCFWSLLALSSFQCLSFSSHMFTCEHDSFLKKLPGKYHFVSPNLFEFEIIFLNQISRKTGDHYIVNFQNLKSIFQVILKFTSKY